MTTSSIAQSQLTTINFFNCFKENPRILAITTVVFEVLGIVLGAASIITTSVPVSTFLAIAAFVSLGISGALTYFAIQQARNPTQRADLIQVMNETLDDLKRGNYTAANGTLQQLDTRAAAAGVTLHLSGGNVCQRAGGHTTLISVKNKDCLYAAKELLTKGLKPIVLDMANGDHFGGGYLTGARAQEEDCCRRSGLSLAVDNRHGLQTRNFYPLSQQSASAGLYVPSVPVFRAGADKGYLYLDRPFNVAFGVIDAINSPAIDNSGEIPRLFPAETLRTREKIRTFFEMARQKGHDSVVFGALGCGAFRNPPGHIAEITLDVINKEFKHCFKEIVIAIIDDHNAGLSHNPGGNFNPFALRVLSSGGKAFDSNDQEMRIIA